MSSNELCWKRNTFILDECCQYVFNVNFCCGKCQFIIDYLDDNQITDELIDRLVQQASSEVNRAVAETVRHLQDRRRPRTPGDLMSLMKFPKPLQLTLAKTEDIFERALDLVHRYVDNITFSSDHARNEMRTIGNDC